VRVACRLGRRSLVAAVAVASSIAALALGISAAQAAPPTIAISNVSQNEGNAGTTNFVFTVVATRTEELDRPQEVRVDYGTANGTATGGLACGGEVDYVTTSGQLTLAFAAGAAQATGTITVPVCGDTLVEGDEIFVLNLTRPPQGTIVAAVIGTIRNDDAATLTATPTPTAPGPTPTPPPTTPPPPSPTATPTAPPPTPTPTRTAAPPPPTATPSPTPSPPPTTPRSISVGDASVIEGNVGEAALVFTIRLSAPSQNPVAVNFATANGTATAPGDYGGASGTVTFGPGETSRTITVFVVGDTTPEGNETLFLNLSTPINATISKGQGVGTIIDDDGKPSLSISDVSVNEGNSGTVEARFTVTLAPASGETVTVNSTTGGGTASVSDDYAPAGALLSFAPGETTKVVVVAVKGDTVHEGNETFFVDLVNETNATVGKRQGTGTIVDDDPAGTQTPPSAKGPKVTVVTATVTLSPRGVAEMRLRCPTGTAGGCKGSVNLEAFTASATRDKLAVGYTFFSIASGETGTISVRVSPAALAFIRRSGRLSVTAVIVATDASGSSRTTVKTITLQKLGVFVLSSVAVLSRAGLATIAVQCPSEAVGGCRGTLKLLAKQQLGRESFALASGRKRSVGVRLSPSGRALVSRRKRVKATAIVVATLRLGKAKPVRATTVHTVMLRAARP
jgi:hypothetical protein